jgi:hypothetical protein
MELGLELEPGLEPDIGLSLVFWVLGLETNSK